jgi:hypothetical protein
MERAANRNFSVEYFDKGGDVWVVATQLKDDQHDIELNVEIDMSEMIITDARIKFNRYPVAHCTMIEKNASQLMGLKIDNEFIRNAMGVFMGAEGCPNIMSLLHVSIPGIIYFYYPYKIKTGEMEAEQFDHIIKTELKNACLAHTML